MGVACSKKDNTIKPQYKELIQAVYASGKLYPVNYYKVLSKYPAYVHQILVKPGQIVKKGQPLAILKNEMLQNNLSAARNTFQLAQKKYNNNSPVLKAALNDMNSLKVKYENDSINYIRISNLYNANASSKQQLDAAKLQFESSKQLFLKSKNNYQILVDNLEAEYKNAEENLKAIENNTQEYIIKSEIDGKVYNVDVQPGDLINPNKVIFEIGDSNQFEVELYVDESDVALLKPMQEVWCSIDAYGDNVFKGTLLEIYPSINQQNKAAKVIAQVNGIENPLCGMSVEANIIVAKKNKTLVIPREFIVNTNQVKVKGENELRKIKIGISDLDYVEVLEGLSETDVIEKK
jgi:multidrug efflux pump subunit AcrA (membrane-fusion protein)